MKKIGQNNKQISKVWIKSVYFSVDLVFKDKMEQHINICSRSQTNKCKNNQTLLFDLPTNIYDFYKKNICSALL